LIGVDLMPSRTINISVKDLDLLKDIMELWKDMRDDDAIPVAYRVRLGEIIERFHSN